MGIFGRKKKETAEAVEEITPVELEGEPGVDRPWEREHDGPFDVAERDSLSGRLDLGALRVPAVPGMEMRLDVDKKSSAITGVTCTIQGSKLQLQAFAAPRREGLWDEIRKGLAEGITGAGGASQIDPDGVMGKELVARMRTQDANGRAAVAHNRFIGVDGPRWFLRAVINGPAATDAAQLAVVRKFLRAVVVDRGDDPRPPREVLTLTAPKGVIEEATKRRAAERAAAAAKGVAAATGAGAAGAATAGAPAAGAPATGPAPTGAPAADAAAGSPAETADQGPDNGTTPED
ncbi:DUF3710 domain-containing protein [Ornithinimicrobium ciconiae]|uniref:DUF3710 domain-containing protein n=1 Tax=Ornithinimicrobium ciconiae TaxID=2594265 RepID=A0A516GAC4_9MICO|nr:DUF3710 domain-containing protein [Ornithinimicrobium ciconiae]QDO88469.1 DUF3710 domain-containing protein [Ornithinimicrobium ciconiae]